MDVKPARRTDSHFVASLEKAMRVLEAFGPEQARLGLTELSIETGLDRSSVQRLTTTLHQLGYLDKDATTKRFSPSIRMTELANRYLWSDDLVKSAMPRLIDLRQALGETINFSRLDGTDIVYTARLPSSRTSYAAMIIGRRVPALNTSSGRVMLALREPGERQRAIEEWPMQRFTSQTTMDREAVKRLVEEAAETGYSIAENELQMNELALAVAVNRNGEPGGAIHCSVSGTVWTRERLREDVMPRLRDVANAIG
ncbi:transcriptional regulator, IclR family [Fulvimarina manganoxydans]|uniref:Transcriptional regulator, IclR family n=1 Tax=Fulvimarina manganoxydans TaxID=937218 RepID=A0A1W1YAD6_9HYPH|nr:transcriptional regulator, IclR family [Fulvimarina manganoxydans]